MSKEKAIRDAMWAEDTDCLFKLAPCKCCCDEHTFESCDARLWNGCRGQNNTDISDREAWQRHYEANHGMTWGEFYSYD